MTRATRAIAHAPHAEKLGRRGEGGGANTGGRGSRGHRGNKTWWTGSERRQRGRSKNGTGGRQKDGAGNGGEYSTGDGDGHRGGGRDQHGRGTITNGDRDLYRSMHGCAGGSRRDMSRRAHRGSESLRTRPTVRAKSRSLSPARGDADGHPSKDGEDRGGPRRVAKKSGRNRRAACRGHATEKANGLGTQAAACGNAESAQGDARAWRRLAAPPSKVLSATLVLLKSVDHVADRVRGVRPKVRVTAMLRGLDIDDHPGMGAVEAAEHQVGPLR